MFILSTCSTADLTQEYLESRNVYYIKFHYTKDNEMYDDDFYKSISAEDFFDSMVAGSVMTTSQVNTWEFTAYFKTFLEQGKDILHLCLSSGISGAYNSARAAAKELSQQYPERKIHIVDSLCASSGLGLLVDKLADLRDSGMSFDEAVAWVEENKLRVHHWFFTSDLTFFIRGGRVSKVAGTVAGVLGICPLMNVSNEGKLIVRDKIRPKKRVIEETVKRMQMYADDGFDYSGKVFMSHSNCIEDCRAVADLVEAKFPKINNKVQINSIGTVIGSHTGPGTVALFFFGQKRDN